MNLKYVKLGYHYLINHVFLSIYGVEVGSLRQHDLWKLCEQHQFDLTTALTFSSGAIFFILYLYFLSRPRSIYLMDFSYFKTSNDLKINLFFLFFFLTWNKMKLLSLESTHLLSCQVDYDGLNLLTLCTCWYQQEKM